MSVSERLRAALPGSDDSADDAGGSAGSGWVRGAVVGLLTGLTSLVVVLAPVVLAWLVEPLATGDGWQAVGTGAALWLLVSGAHLAIGEVTVSLVPLLGLALLVAVAWLGAREAMVDVSTDGEHWRGTLPRPLAAALGAWWAGYAVAVGVAVGLAVAGPFRVTPLSLVVPVLLVPLLALVLALRPVSRDDPDVLGPRLGFAWLPDSVRRSVRPGLVGAAILLAVGLVVVLALVALSWAEVSTISTAVAAGGLGGVVLALAQVASLPNLALWAVSFIAGPGFRVVEGGSVTWSGSEGGLLPMVPVLAALPQPGTFPWFTAGVGARRRRGRGLRRPPGAGPGRAALPAAHQARRRPRRVHRHRPDAHRARPRRRRLARPVPSLGRGCPGRSPVPRPARRAGRRRARRRVP